MICYRSHDRIGPPDTDMAIFKAAARGGVEPYGFGSVSIYHIRTPPVHSLFVSLFVFTR